MKISLIMIEIDKHEEYSVKLLTKSLSALLRKLKA
jgi:hypothetical protein